MSSAAGSSIATSGLVLDFDAANTRSYGYPTVEVLVVGGGGGGGGRHAGGGGGGGVLYNSMFAVTVGAAITVTVGAGGTAAPFGGIGGNGGNSTFSTLTAIGGGGGGGYSDGGATVIGATGGSGGGAAGAIGLPGGTGTPGAGTIGQGFAGGASGSSWAGGGGGGAGSAGGTGGGGIGGNGGNGLPYSVSGSSIYYGGGGGGAGDGNADLSGGAGGLGGGGRGTGAYNPVQGVAGTANTGGGGGGSRDQAGTTGGSGIVVIRYPGGQKASGGTITNVNGFTIHTFTANGTFTPGTHGADVSNSNNTGTLVNGPTYSSANGGVLVTDGVDDYVNFNNLNLSTGAYTVMAAVRYSGSIKGRIITAINNNWLMGNWSATTENYYAEGWVTGSSTGANDNTWRIITATGNTATDVWQLYVNGVLTTETTGGSAGPNGLSICGNSEKSTSETGFVLAYNRVLSAAEVKQNFNATRSRYGI